MTKTKYVQIQLARTSAFVSQVTQLCLTVASVSISMNVWRLQVFVETMRIVLILKVVFIAHASLAINSTMWQANASLSKEVTLFDFMKSNNFINL